MIRLAILLVLLLCPALSGQIKGPDKVGPGEAIHLEIADVEPGDIIRWRLLYPRGGTVKQITTRYGVDFVLDPATNFLGPVEVEVRILNWTKQRLIEDEHITTVGNAVDPPPDDDDDDPPPDDGDPPPDGDYTGPNELGIGKISFANAPDNNKDVVVVLKQAQEYLFGRPSLKVWFAENETQNKSEYNVHVWLANQMQAKANTDAWGKWHAACYKRLEELNRTGMTIQQRYDAFGEMAAGVEAKR